METDDDLFLQMVEGVTVTVLDRIGGDREARHQFFKRFVELAREIAPGPEDRRGWADWDWQTDLRIQAGQPDGESGAYRSSTSITS